MADWMNTAWYAVIAHMLMAAGLSVAVIAFLRTPKNQRLAIPAKVAHDPAVHAPLYSKAELQRHRINSVLWCIPIGLALLVVYWLVENGECITIGNYVGMTLVLYLVMIAIPFCFLLHLWLTQGRSALDVWRAQQWPLQGQKTATLVAYRRGWKAKLHVIYLATTSLLCYGILIYSAIELLPMFTFYRDSIPLPTSCTVTWSLLT